YLTQHRPPALVATFPPSVDQAAEAGSGGYHSPSRATRSRRSALTTPGCTVTVCWTGSTCSTWFIRSKETTTQPCTALAPPDKPVPAPRATTGTPAPAHTCTSACTSWVWRGRTTAAGLP